MIFTTKCLRLWLFYNFVTLRCQWRYCGLIFYQVFFKRVRISKWNLKTTPVFGFATPLSFNLLTFTILSIDSNPIYLISIDSFLYLVPLKHFRPIKVVVWTLFWMLQEYAPQHQCSSYGLIHFETDDCILGVHSVQP